MSHSINNSLHVFHFIVPFNNMRTLKFKAQPTNAFSTPVNQMFSGSSQLSTTAELVVPVIKLLFTVETMKQYSVVVTTWEDLLNI